VKVGHRQALIVKKTPSPLKRLGVFVCALETDPLREKPGYYTQDVTQKKPATLSRIFVDAND
jgi:hypothetical protein